MIGYIIYGRLKSKRLPKKALLKLNGKSLIRVLIDRISMSSRIDNVVFATSDLEDDKPLAKLAMAEGLEVYCGYPEDVLLRLLETANKFHFDYFLTTMIDSPFQLSEVIDTTVDKLIWESFDMLYSYPSQPNGTDCYGVKTEALKRVIDMKKTSNTECWGRYFTDTGLFKWGEVNLFGDYSHLTDFRLTIDYPEDYEFCKVLYQELVSMYGIGFTFGNVVEVLETDTFKKLQHKMRELSKKWENHFSSCTVDVDRDVERIIKLQQSEAVV